MIYYPLTAVHIYCYLGLHIYLVTPEQTSENPISLEDVKKDAQFVNELGQDEDREAACLIQQTVTAQANSHLTFDPAPNFAG